MLEKTAFNAPDGQPYQLVQLTNSNGMTVQFMDWGATWLSCKVPVNGELREVLLGCKGEDYPHQTAYLGASVGRYANRIANAQFELGERTIQLVPNQGKHQLHGGKEGFDKRRWKVEECGQNFVRFSLVSPDGDQGFEGNVQVNVLYTLTDENSVKIEYEAESDKDTALNSLVAKRARHVVTENQRVLDAVEALKHNDLTKLGELMGQSHESMRDDFEITVPQIDYLVELAQLVIGKTGGARMTGGGFGGCIVALAPHDKVEEVRKIIADNYEKQTGLKEDFYVCTASQGVSLC